MGVCLQVPMAMATPADVRILTVGQPTLAARETLEALIQRYPMAISDIDAQKLLGKPGAGISLALGADALKGLLEAGANGPILALLTSSETFRAIVASSGVDRRRSAIGAIYAEASPAHQFSLIRLIFQRRITVGVLLSENTAYIEPMIRANARNTELDVEIHRLERGENPIRALSRLSSANVLLALPDKSIFSPETIQAILEATYRRGQPVVGFSSALVRAGTLASVYSTVDDVVAQAVALIEQLAIGQAPPLLYPAYWRVAVNESVARSLNIPIGDEARGFSNHAR